MPIEVVLLQNGNADLCFYLLFNKNSILKCLNFGRGIISQRILVSCDYGKTGAGEICGQYVSSPRILFIHLDKQSAKIAARQLLTPRRCPKNQV
ncbi:MAG: hypothetical protein LBV07_02495 [Syntrophobacterales bacterium]|nr:hypothetical protein [Syntrophobacterales bacterium]